jgi:hypothetical protein
LGTGGAALRVIVDIVDIVDDDALFRDCTDGVGVEVFVEIAGDFECGGKMGASLRFAVAVDGAADGARLDAAEAGEWSC